MGLTFNHAYSIDSREVKYIFSKTRWVSCLLGKDENSDQVNKVVDIDKQRNEKLVKAGRFHNVNLGEIQRILSLYDFIDLKLQLCSRMLNRPLRFLGEYVAYITHLFVSIFLKNSIENFCM